MCVCVCFECVSMYWQCTNGIVVRPIPSIEVAFEPTLCTYKLCDYYIVCVCVCVCVRDRERKRV